MSERIQTLSDAVENSIRSSKNVFAKSHFKKSAPIVFSFLLFVLIAGSFLFSMSTHAASTTWTGAVSSDWALAGNWSLGTVPGTLTDVVIPSAGTTANDPGVSANANCYGLTIESGGILNGNGQTLTVGANWTNNGTFNHENGTVVMGGTSSQAATIVSGSSAFNNLEVYKTYDYGNHDDVHISGVVDVAGNFTQTDGELAGGQINVGGDYIIAATAHGAAADYVDSATVVSLNHASNDQSILYTAGGMGTHIQIDKAGGTLSIPSDLSASGWTYVKGAVTGMDTHTLTIGDSFLDTFIPGSLTYGNVTVSKYHTGNSWDDLTIGSGTWNVGGNLNIVSGDVHIDANNPNINISGNLSISSGAGFNKGTGLLTFSGTAPSVFNDANAVSKNIGNVAINKTNATEAQDKLTLSSNLMCDTFSIDGTTGQGDTLDMGNSGYILTLAKAGNVADVFTANGAIASGNSTIRYAATNSGGNINICPATYNSLELSGSETYVFAGDISIDGDLIIGAPSTLNTSLYNLALNGNFANSGAFIPNTNSVTLGGTDQTLTGNTSFYNLAKHTVAADTLTFAAGSTTTITSAGIISLSGASDAGRLSLRSSAAGAQWNLNVDNAAFLTEFSYLDLQDSNAAGKALTTYDSNDSGNNVGWTISAESTPVPTEAPVETLHWNSNSYGNINTITDLDDVTFRVNYDKRGEVKWYKDGVLVQTGSNIFTSDYTTAWTGADYDKVKEMKVVSSNAIGNSIETVWKVEVRQDLGAANVAKNINSGNRVSGLPTMYVSSGTVDPATLYLACKQGDNYWMEYLSAGSYLFKKNLWIDGATMEIDDSNSTDVYFSSTSISVTAGAVFHVDRAKLHGPTSIGNSGNNDFSITNSYLEKVTVYYSGGDSLVPDLIDNNIFYKASVSVGTMTRAHIISNNTFKYGSFMAARSDVIPNVKVKDNIFFAQPGSGGNPAHVGQGMSFIGNEGYISSWNIFETASNILIKDNNAHDNAVHNSFNGITDNAYLDGNYCHDNGNYACYYMQYDSYANPYRVFDHIYIFNDYVRDTKSGIDVKLAHDIYLYNHTAKNLVNREGGFGMENLVFRKSDLENIGATSYFGGEFATLDTYIIDSSISGQALLWGSTSLPENEWVRMHSVNSNGGKNEDGTLKKAPLNTYGNLAAEGMDYVYLDVLAQDGSGDPIANATITVEPLTDNGFHDQFPAVSVLLPPPPPTLESWPSENLPLPSISTFESVRTGADGHTPLPNYGWSQDVEATPAILYNFIHHYSDDGGTLPGHRPHTDYQYRITATFGNQSVSTIVTPDVSWLREDPTIPAKTLVLTLDKPEGKVALHVNGGSGSGIYSPGENVAIAAGSAVAGKVFSKWIGDTTGVADVNSASTSFIAQSVDASVSAYYRDVTYHLTVTDGEGTGDYPAGKLVSIKAAAKNGNLKFNRWQGTGLDYVNHPDVYSSGLIMPAQDISVNSTYVDTTDATYHLSLENTTLSMCSYCGTSTLEGSGDYRAGDVVPIYAAPLEGYKFAPIVSTAGGWNQQTDYYGTIADRGSAATTFTMPDTDVVIYSWFAPDSAYHALVVNSGAGDGSYVAGTSVTVTADAPLAGQVFDRWTGDVGQLADADSASTVFTVPSTGPLAITANFKASDLSSYTLAVNDGTGSGSYLAGAVVDVSAGDLINQTFSHWTGDTGAITTGTVNSATIAVTMLGEDTSLTAVYSESTYSLNINNGSGAGSYVFEKPLIITADAAPAGQVFDHWTGDTYYLSNPETPIALLTMPSTAIDLTATYKVISPSTYPLIVTNGYGSGSYASSAGVTVTANAPLKGRAFDSWTGDTQYIASGSATDRSVTLTMPPSAVNLTATYKDALLGAVAIPTFSPAAGTYSTAQTVTFSSATPEALIRYTTDGTNPTVDSHTYINPLVVSATTTFKAMAMKEGYSTSSVVSAIFTIGSSTGGGSGSGGGGGGGSSSGGSGGSGGTTALTPVINKIEITSVTDNKVNLTLSVTNASFMMLSDNSKFTGAIWIPYNAAYVYTKSDTQTKLYLKFKSSTNTVSGVTEMTITAGSTGGSSGVYPNGTLLKIPTSFKVYVMIEGKKKWIPTPEVFQQLGYQWTEIKVLTQDQLNLIPDFEDNLIRALGNYKVYLVVNGVKRHIPNPEVFLNYGFAWEDVVDVPQETVDKYKNTYLIKESGKDGLYYINAGEIRKLIPTTEVFNSYNDKIEDIQVISNYEMNYYPNSNLIKLGGSNDIYLIEGTTKKRIPNPQVFSKYKLNWNLVMSVNQAEFDFYEDRAELK